MASGAEKPGTLIVLCGPSGVGKSTIARKLASEVKLKYIVSATTRPKRPNDEKGKIYDYINVQGDSALKPLTGNDIIGYKNHHQAVDMSYFKKNSDKHSTVKITATSHDGKIPEVMEWTDRPALGIQYHAERSNAYSMKTPRAEQSDRHGPYLWLLKKACTKRNKKAVQDEASAVEVVQ